MNAIIRRENRRNEVNAIRSQLRRDAAGLNRDFDEFEGQRSEKFGQSALVRQIDR
jgi:hypothetical protein